MLEVDVVLRVGGQRISQVGDLGREIAAATVSMMPVMSPRRVIGRSGNGVAAVLVAAVAVEPVLVALVAEIALVAVSQSVVLVDVGSELPCCPAA
ncbi:MAG: hypothetical protein CBARDCOR_6775 [uncultured Caballeronia sp.]|nr:MAG: hypothetical protein CBARDCOR_6775 [uncultured Caballeronia sp.]